MAHVSVLYRDNPDSGIVGVYRDCGPAGTAANQIDGENYGWYPQREPDGRLSMRSTSGGWIAMDVQITE